MILKKKWQPSPCPVYAENNLRFFTECINFHGKLAGVHYTEILDMSCMNKAIYYTFVNLSYYITL